MDKKTVNEHLKQLVFYNGYLGILKYSKKDKCYCGKVIGNKYSKLKGLISFEGKTIGEAKYDFRRGVRDYMDSLKQFS